MIRLRLFLLFPLVYPTDNSSFPCASGRVRPYAQKTHQAAVNFPESRSLAGSTAQCPSFLKSLMEKIRRLPTQAYLLQKSLVAYPYLANREIIEQFFSDYAGSPLDAPLRESCFKLSGTKKIKENCFL